MWPFRRNKIDKVRKDMPEATKLFYESLDEFASDLAKQHLTEKPLIRKATAADALVSLIRGAPVIAVDKIGFNRIFTDTDTDLHWFLSVNTDKDKTTFFIVESDDAVIDYRHRGAVWDPAEYHEDLANGKELVVVKDSYEDTLIFAFNGRGVEMFTEGDIESFLFESDHLETLDLIVAKLKTEEGE